ncbi:hypothetical protein I3843_06G080100 [Carya illinoinensis]|nr:hypothetical protein I3843_06G080100 [Carya illinoinensis]
MHKCSKITWTAETQAFGHAGIKQQENTCSRGKTHGQQKKIIRTMQEHSHMCSRNITCRNSLGSYTPAHMQAAHTKHSTQTTCSSHKLRTAHIQLHTTEAIITQLIRITPSCRKHSDSNHAWDPNKHIIATQPLTRKGY